MGRVRKTTVRSKVGARGRRPTRTESARLGVRRAGVIRTTRPKVVTIRGTGKPIRSGQGVRFVKKVGARGRVKITGRPIVTRASSRPKPPPIIRTATTSPSRTLPAVFGLAARSFLGVPEERIATRGTQIIQKSQIQRRTPTLDPRTTIKITKIRGARGTRKGTRFTFIPFQETEPSRPFQAVAQQRKDQRTRGQQRVGSTPKRQQTTRDVFRTGLTTFGFIPFQAAQQVQKKISKTARGIGIDNISDFIFETNIDVVFPRVGFGTRPTEIGETGQITLDLPKIGLSKRKKEKREDDIGSDFDVLNFFG